VALWCTTTGVASSRIDDTPPLLTAKDASADRASKPSIVPHHFCDHGADRDDDDEVEPLPPPTAVPPPPLRFWGNDDESIILDAKPNVRGFVLPFPLLALLQHCGCFALSVQPGRGEAATIVARPSTSIILSTVRLYCASLARPALATTTAKI